MPVEGQGPDDQFNSAKEALFGVSAPENVQVDDIRYPEALLHETTGAFKLYSSLQRYTRQFVGEETSGHIIRWQGLEVETLLRSIVDQWAVSDRQTLSENTPSSPQKSVNIAGRSSASGLFSWSSGDSYIEARKREKRGPIEPVTTLYNNSGNESPVPEETPSEAQKSPVSAKVKLINSKSSLTNALNRVIERESSRFIHDRIQLIKAHHSEQISKKIHERKRKDHELHLQRLKQKEEEYERALQAAMAEQNQARSIGFFGSLFGLSSAPTTRAQQESDAASLHSLESQRPGDKTSPSTHKNKRFSFLPGTGLWGKKKDDMPEDLFDIDKETEGGAQDPEDFEDGAEEQENVQEMAGQPLDRSEGSQADGILAQNSPSLTQKKSDFIHRTASVVTGTQDKQHALFGVPVSKNQPPLNVTASPGGPFLPTKEVDDDFDEFSVFASAPPIKTPPLERRFMKLEKGLPPAGTLIDLTGPETADSDNLVNL